MHHAALRSLQPLAQAALLAGLPKSPTTLDPYQYAKPDAKGRLVVQPGSPPIARMAYVLNGLAANDSRWTSVTPTELQAAMKADLGANGKPVWTPLVGVSLLVWFVLAMQCMSTLAIGRRETGGWKWPIAMLVYMNALAYGVCLVVYQVGRMLA